MQAKTYRRLTEIGAALACALLAGMAILGVVTVLK